MAEYRFGTARAEERPPAVPVETAEPFTFVHINKCGGTAVELALGLPASVGALDLDRQLTEFRDKTSARFGDGEVAQFTDPAKREELVRVFLLRAELQGGGGTVQGASAALSLLQSSGGAGGLLSTLL